ncbi:glycosyltransferase [Candidatus Dependentiae bacterium]|nr:glycosyltransferase [Candidatus Dependentiae bacterium]
MNLKFFLIFISLYVNLLSESLVSEHFISFIIPCYNCEKTVKGTVESIYNQKISYPFEVVCTDDCSTDGTLKLLKSFEEKYDNFRVIMHEQNQGGGPASNTCIKHSQGDLLFRLDSDNMLAENTINRLVELLDNTGCDGASVEELRFFTGDKIKHNSWFYKAKNNVCDIFHVLETVVDPVHSGNYLFTKESYLKAGGYCNWHSAADTFCFGFKQYATGSRIAILPDSFYWHLYNPNGYWCREQEKGTNDIKDLETFCEFEEIFTKETRQLLHNLKRDPRQFFSYLTQGKYVLISNEALKELFLGHDFKQKGLFSSALIHFKKAKKLGCSSIHLNELISTLEKS